LPSISNKIWFIAALAALASCLPETRICSSPDGARRERNQTYAPGVPVIELFVGDGEGQVPLRKLQKHVTKLPKKLTPHQMREVRARLKAVGGMSLPIPKGPMPKGVKIR